MSHEIDPYKVPDPYKVKDPYANNHDPYKETHDPYKVNDPYKTTHDPYARKDEFKNKPKGKSSNFLTLVILAALLGVFLAVRF